MHNNGPAWLGIGAQRCGTTWFTELLLQHPSMSLSTEGRKELHLLYPDLRSTWSETQIDTYKSLFTNADGLAGEFTPYYLRALWVPPIAAAVCEPSAPLIVLLRDPIERFASAMRHEFRRLRRRGENPSSEWVRWVASDAQWAGMYATQLDGWRRVIGRRRLLVFQYEQVVSAPQRAAERVWQYLGLSPVTLSDVQQPSRTATSGEEWSWEGRDALRDQLRHLYRPEVRRLRRWGIDRRLWPNFG